MQKRVLVVGIGNPIMKDEALGGKVIEELDRRDLPTHTEAVFAGTSVFDTLAGRGGGKLVIVDAASAGGEPGTVYVHRAGQGDLRGGAEYLSAHDRGLPEALAELALAGDEWDEVVLVGVEPGDVSFGEELTPAVRKALGKVVETVERECSPGE